MVILFPLYQLYQRKKYEMYQLFKDKNISKSTIYQTIKDCENGLPCVVKPKIGEPRVADSKKVRNVLPSIKNLVEVS
jgi:predicted transcriptional regulator